MMDHRLFVRESGPAGRPAIVFLHGGGFGGWMWDPQVAVLSRDYHCLVPDLPEQGESRGAGPFTIGGAAEAVAGLIRDRTRDGRAHVVGLSLGAQVAVALLNQHAEVVDHAMTSGTSVRPVSIVGLFKLLVRLYQPFKNPPVVVRLTMRAAGVPEQYYPQFRKDMRRLSAGALNRALAENAAFRVPANLGAVDVPTLVAVGEKEIGAVYASARDLMHVLPRAAEFVALGQGHLWNLTAPELFAATVRAWIEDQPLPAGMAPLR